MYPWWAGEWSPVGSPCSGIFLKSIYELSISFLKTQQLKVLQVLTSPHLANPWTQNPFMLFFTCSL